MNFLEVNPMESSKFILHGDIYNDDIWELESHSNVVTGQKDLIGEQIKAFMDTINPRWNWNMADFQK